MAKKQRKRPSKPDGVSLNGEQRASVARSQRADLRALEKVDVPFGLRKTIESMDGTFDPDVADFILNRMADGLTLATACIQLSVEPRWVRLWILHNAGEDLFSNPPRLGMRELYRRARQMQTESWADEIVEIADECVIDDEQRSKLRIETRKWLMAKFDDKYADRATLVHEGGRTPVRVLHSLDEIREMMRERGLPTHILTEPEEK